MNAKVGLKVDLPGLDQIGYRTYEPDAFTGAGVHKINVETGYSRNLMQLGGSDDKRIVG